MSEPVQKVDDSKTDSAEQKQAENNSGMAEGTKPNLWLPDASWATSLMNTAKEKTKSTFETMKKDINEFSDTIQHGANTLATATVKQAQIIQTSVHHLIAPSADLKEENPAGGDQKIADSNDTKSEESKASKVKSSSDADAAESNKEGGVGLFGMGWMKQVVDTVHKFATEDTTKDEEECTEEIRVGLGGRRTILDQCTLLQLQNDVRTFLQPPQQNVDLYKEWLTDFKIAEYNGEINILLGHNPRLREIYAELVPAKVDNHTFWNRYFFKVHLKELDRQIAMGAVGAPKLQIDKILGPGSNGEGHSPAPSNGKDDWSMCSSGMTTEAEELENGDGAASREEASTPRPSTTQKDEDADDWEECEDEQVNEAGTKTSAKTK